MGCSRQTSAIVLPLPNCSSYLLVWGVQGVRREGELYDANSIISPPFSRLTVVWGVQGRRVCVARDAGLSWDWIRRGAGVMMCLLPGVVRDTGGVGLGGMLMCLLPVVGRDTGGMLV